MKVAQQADTLTLFGAVQSLQRIVSNAPSQEAMRHQAEAEGFDPDFVDEVMKRVRADSNKNFLQRKVSTKAISAALLGLLDETDDADGTQRGSRAMVWHQAREALKKSGEKFGVWFGEVDEAMEELEGLYFPRGLTKLGDAKLAMFRPFLEARVYAENNLHKLGEQLTTWLKQTAGLDERQLEAHLLRVAGKEAESAPWKLALAKAFARTTKGKRGEEPSAEDLAEMFLNLGLLEELMGEIEQGPDGMWAWTLQTQAQVLRAHQSVGDALMELADLAA